MHLKIKLGSGEVKTFIHFLKENGISYTIDNSPRGKKKQKNLKNHKNKKVIRIRRVRLIYLPSIMYRYVDKIKNKP